MTRRWNGKALIDEVAARTWSANDTTFRERLIEWSNQIQNDLSSEIPVDYYKFRLKKQLPTNQELISLNVEKPSAPSVDYATTTATISYNSTTSGNFVSNSNIVYGASSATLATTSSNANETFYANFTSSIDGWRGAGTLTGTSVNGATISNGVLDLTGGTNKYVSYNADGNADSQQTLTVEFDVTPNYTGTPASNQFFFNIRKNSTSLHNMIDVQHNATSGIFVTAYNSSAALVFSTNLGAWAPTSGTTYSFSLNVDATTGSTKLFIDGTQFGSTIVSTWTRDSNIEYFALGVSSAKNETPNFSLNDFRVFSTVQRTTTYTPASYVPDYNDAEQTIEVSTGTSIDELYTFTAVTNEPTNTQIGFILDVDGTDKYWDGSAWSASDGSLAQSNTAAVINTNAAALLSTTGTVKVMAVLYNTSEEDTPSITSVTLGDIGLVDGTTYKIYATFVIYDEDMENYIESELGTASAAIVADLTDQDISVTSIDTYDGDATVAPANIYRRIYMAKLTSGETAYGEPLFVAEIQDNSTTTYTITADTTSTITPPSDSEIDQISSDHPFFVSGNRWLSKVDMNAQRRFDPDSSTSTSPYAYDHVGTDKINLYPKLATTATTAQRTLSYWVYRRPHEIFYDVDREIDLPISAKKALIEGIVWLAYEYRDRDRAQEKLRNYEEFKAQFKNKINRTRVRPGVVRDVSGDTFGMEV